MVASTTVDSLCFFLASRLTTVSLDQRVVSNHWTGPSNSEEIKPVALSIVELHLAEGIGQSVSQLVENSAK